jgi:peptide-methionine (S)-S-oxide reductase
MYLCIYVKVDFGEKLKPGSIKSGKVGFMTAIPNAAPNPSYREVCSGSTGYVEVYDCEFDGDETTYEEMVKHFYKFHDPTTMNRQGNDCGTQYASAIFCYDDKQMEIAKKVTEELEAHVKAGAIKLYQGNTVKTAITREAPFYAAEEDHQEYLEKNPWGYCNHGYRFKEWPLA